MSGENILGIDPGKTGALVLLSPSGEILRKFVIPIGSDGELDLETLGKMFFVLSDETAMAFLEKPNGTAMTKGHGRGQSISAMFNFGETCGVLRGMLAAFRIPFQLIPPVRWTARMLGPKLANMTTKQRARMMVERLFPNDSLLATPKSKVPHEGLVDALLIAEFGRQTMGFQFRSKEKRYE